MRFFDGKKEFQRFAKDTGNEIRADWNMATGTNSGYTRFTPSCAIVIEGVHVENVNIEDDLEEGVIKFQGLYDYDFFDCDYLGPWTGGTYIFFQLVEDALLFKLHYGEQFA